MLVAPDVVTHEVVAIVNLDALLVKLNELVTFKHLVQTEALLVELHYELLCMASALS